jgi:Fic family protein
MKNLEEFINHDHDDTDYLIKMAIIHHQFESIHPFFDGNGRTGRIINVLYLVLKKLLDFPILYLSRYIINSKANYYKLLQLTRDTGDWKEWVLYILDGVEQTAEETISRILKIRKIHQQTRDLIQNKLPKLYSRELIDGLFLHPYTKIEYIQKLLGITRQTASNYLNKLVDVGILNKIKFGTTYLFVNQQLFALLTD